MSQQITAKTTR